MILRSSKYYLLSNIYKSGDLVTRKKITLPLFSNRKENYFLCIFEKERKLLSPRFQDRKKDDLFRVSNSSFRVTKLGHPYLLKKSNKKNEKNTPRRSNGERVSRYIKIEIIRIFRGIVTWVLSEDFWCFYNENESKHDLVSVIFNCSTSKEFPEKHPTTYN